MDRIISFAGLGILALMYAGVLVHTKLGSKYTFIYIVAGLGCFQAIGSVFAQLDFPNAAYLWIVVNPAFFGLYWVLASKYRRTANEI
jgi:hypothetical protein